MFRTLEISMQGSKKNDYPHLSNSTIVKIPIEIFFGKDRFLICSYGEFFVQEKLEHF